MWGIFGVGVYTVGDLSTARIRTSVVNSYTSLAAPCWNFAVVVTLQNAFLLEPLDLEMVAESLVMEN